VYHRWPSSAGEQAPDVTNVPPARAPAASVLIVSYRAYAELTACLESLQRFISDDDVEVIVVDHSSEPGAARALRERFPSVTLIEEPHNPGFAAGVNRAARSARGRYLLLLNPDCVVNEDVVLPLATWLDEHPSVGALGTLVREPDGSVQASARRFPNVTAGFAGRTTWLTRVWPGNPWTRHNLQARASRDPTEVDWVSGACMTVRREAFDAVGGMDEQFFLYWEDADFCYRLKRAGWSTVYYPAVEVTHFTGRSSAQARTASLVAFHRSAYRYFRKHAGRAARLASPFVCLALYSRLLLKLVSNRLSG
jgi:GT2 family glycosyltransferase